MSNTLIQNYFIIMATNEQYKSYLSELIAYYRKYRTLSGCLGDKVDEVYECRLPLLFINGRADYTPLFMAKCDNNGTSYYIAKSPLILLCLARMCKSLEKEGWK